MPCEDFDAVSQEQVPSVRAFNFVPILDTLIHPAARWDARIARRHRQFVEANFAAGLLALVAVAGLWVCAPPRDTWSVMALAWLCSPLLIAFLPRLSPRLVIAQGVALVNLAALVIFLGALTGGVRSFLIPWLIIVPVEAAASGEKRLIALGVALGAGGLALLAALDHLALLPPSLLPLDGVPGLYALGTALAVVYAAGLALTIESNFAEAEQAARAGESRYRLLADNAGDLITRHSADGRIIFASPAAMRLTGLESERMIGLSPSALSHPSDRADVLLAFMRASHLGEEACIAWRLVRRDGREIWVETSCRPARTGSTKAPAADQEIIAVTRDISARKQAEAELVAARDAAEAASRAKSRFLANMSHELRTPLNAIIGFSDMMRQEMFGPLGAPRYSEYATHVHDSGRLLLDLINDVLDMAKIEAGKRSLKREAVDIEAAAHSTLAVIRPLAQSRGLNLRERYQRGIEPISADKRAVKQILLNLLSNAIKFTPTGGDIFVSVDATRADIWLKIRDTGVGIPEEELPRLGKPFEQIEGDYVRAHEGTGLGLALVHALTELHGGAVTIKSARGKGTEVSIRLPRMAHCDPSEAVQVDETTLRGAA